VHARPHCAPRSRCRPPSGARRPGSRASTPSCRRSGRRATATTSRA
jgi:hypothetical protein